MGTVADITRKGHGSYPHPCDAKGLSPIEFLQAVYNDPTLPMSIRIDAARALLPYTEPRPTNSFPPRCKIVIGGLGSTENHSQNRQSAHKTLNHGAEPEDPQNTERYPDPLNLEPFSPDYSIPPTPEEIQEMKAAILALYPDADLSDLPEPRLCECGHWMFYPCKCASIH